MTENAAHRTTGGDEEQERAQRALKVLTDLRIIFQAIQAHSKNVERHCRVSATMLCVLREIAAAGQLRISQVAGSLSIHQSTASNLLDKLEQRGLVSRQRGSRGQDQRVVLVSLTTAGRELLARPDVPQDGPLSEALGRLSAEQLTALGQNLDQLVAVLPLTEKADPKAPPISVNEFNTME